MSSLNWLNELKSQWHRLANSPVDPLLLFALYSYENSIGYGESEEEAFKHVAKEIKRYKRSLVEIADPTDRFKFIWPYIAFWFDRHKLDGLTFEEAFNKVIVPLLEAIRWSDMENAKEETREYEEVPVEEATGLYQRILGALEKGNQTNRSGEA